MEPSVRPDALQVTKQAFFEEVAVSTLKYLDQLYERGDMEKSQFFKKNLARVMTKLPQVKYCRNNVHWLIHHPLPLVCITCTCAMRETF